ncbi:Scr1 family TA system antitoxin-like transcriptional regulator [Nocardia grenadensis]|uniref:Scr1 family TA system antitoxin-like transcriptional regulator n=1 Tax=Nocardia grenadensis TaxID=931537 RepID=UPI0035A22A29
MVDPLLLASLGGHPAQGPTSASPFVLFSFPPLLTSKLQEPPVAYVEGLAGDLYLEREAEVKRFSREAESIRQVALPRSASRDLMLKALKEWQP